MLNRTAVRNTISDSAAFFDDSYFTSSDSIGEIMLLNLVYNVLGLKKRKLELSTHF